MEGKSSSKAPISAVTVVCCVFFCSVIVWTTGKRYGARVHSTTRASQLPDEVDINPASPICAAALLRLSDIPSPVTWPPECPLPFNSPLRLELERAGLPLVEPWCFAERYEGASERILDWNEKFIEKYCSGIASGEIEGTYGVSDDRRVAAALSLLPNLRGSRGMVLGSEYPWVECLALNAGASEVWTFEYSKIVSTHPRLKAKPYKTMAAERISGALPLVDWIVVYSSLEHSGLGRYGDSLNPDGDKDAMLHAWCMLKPGGYLLLGVPMTCSFDGFIQYNAHRTYGFKRLAYIASEFELVDFPERCIKGRVNNDLVLLRKPLGANSHKPTAEDFAISAASANDAFEKSWLHDFFRRIT